MANHPNRGPQPTIIILGAPTALVSDPRTAEKLDAFVRARNALRSAEAAAEGFVSGIRHYNLKDAQKDHAAKLAALADWVEAQARAAMDTTRGAYTYKVGGTAIWGKAFSEAQAIEAAKAEIAEAAARARAAADAWSDKVESGLRAAGASGLLWGERQDHYTQGYGAEEAVRRILYNRAADAQMNAILASEGISPT